MTRLEANNEILKLLTLYVKTYPDWRFEQILSNLGLEKNSFYRESEDTLTILNFGDALIKYE